MSTKTRDKLAMQIYALLVIEAIKYSQANRLPVRKALKEAVKLSHTSAGMFFKEKAKRKL
jgi:hypothetical protein